MKLNKIIICAIVLILVQGQALAAEADPYTSLSSLDEKIDCAMELDENWKFYINPKCQVYLKILDGDDKEPEELYEADNYPFRALTNRDNELSYFKQGHYNGWREFIFLSKIGNLYEIFKSHYSPPEGYTETSFVFEFNDGIQPRRLLKLTPAIYYDYYSDYWTGRLCHSTTKEPYAPARSELAEDSSPMNWAEKTLCTATVDKRTHITDPGYEKPYVVGKDARLSVFHVIDGARVDNAELIFLDAVNTDQFSVSLNMQDAACLNKCDPTPESYTYIGRINERRITMVLNYEKDYVSGLYYYDDIRTPIYFKGLKMVDKVVLSVMDDNQNNQETFRGGVQGGIISGSWESKATDEKLPFTLYMKP